MHLLCVEQSAVCPGAFRDTVIMHISLKRVPLANGGTAIDTPTFLAWHLRIIPGTALRGLEKLISPCVVSCLCAFCVKSTVRQEGISAKEDAL